MYKADNTIKWLKAP